LTVRPKFETKRYQRGERGITMTINEVALQILIETLVKQGVDSKTIAKQVEAFLKTVSK
jgi:hypothetical protein